MFKTIIAAAVMAGGFIFGSAASASMIDFDFYRVTGNSTIDGSGQLQAVATNTTGGVLIDFTVLAGTQSNATIKEIYFSDMGGLFTPPPEIITQTGVSFVAGTANPGELPGNGGATPTFNTTAMLLAQSTQGQGGNANGIQVGDLLTLKLNFTGTYDWADFADDVMDGSFRIGLHVGSLDAGESDSFVSMPQVPLPAGGLLLLTALAGAGVVARRRKTA